MILSKVAAEREPPCIEVDNGHEQERNVPRVVNIESIFAVITPKLHDKVGQKAKRTWNCERSEKKQTTFSPTFKKDFRFHGGTKKRQRLHPCWYVEQAIFFFKMVPRDVTEFSKSDGIIST